VRLMMQAQRLFAITGSDLHHRLQYDADELS
jgi:hypothetical protein